MGQGQTKPCEVRPSFEDNLIDMKLQQKQLEKMAKKSEKQCQSLQRRAKAQLKKGDDESAKMLLGAASDKSREALNLKRTVMKMETVCGKMKSMRMNQEVMETFGNLSAGVASQMAALDMVKMADNVHLLNEKMDDVLIKAKMMDQITQTKEMETSPVAEEMLQMLKQQIALEEKNQLEVVDNCQKEEVRKQQQFIDDLKAL